MILFCIATTFVVCQQIDQAQGKDYSVRTVDSLLRTSSNVIIVDVRTPEEYITGHIKGAVLIDYYSGSFQTQIQKLPKDKPVIVYCRNGKRSASALDIFETLGYSRVHTISGGILSWTRNKLPLITGQQ